MTRSTRNLLALAVAMLLIPMSVDAVAADPMQPSYAKPQTKTRVSPKRRPAAYRLQAIMGTAESRIAIINGQVVKPGDTVGNARLRRVSAGSVELQDRRRRWMLRLPVTPFE